jgi:hypothetical protein
LLNYCRIAEGIATGSWSYQDLERADNNLISAAAHKIGECDAALGSCFARLAAPSAKQ